MNNAYVALGKSLWVLISIPLNDFSQQVAVQEGGFVCFVFAKCDVSISTGCLDQVCDVTGRGSPNDTNLPHL